MPARRKSQAAAPSTRRRTVNGKAPIGATAANGSGGDEASTPKKVVEAAIACILEEGFYRASSNEIARRADVTWGVIQYHFGSREALMLAVLEYAASDLQSALARATITGATLEERIEQ